MYISMHNFSLPIYLIDISYSFIMFYICVLLFVSLQALITLSFYVIDSGYYLDFLIGIFGFLKKMMYFLFNLFAFFCNFLELFELNSYINNIHSSFNFLTDSNIAFYKSFWNDSLGYWYVIFYIYFIVSYLETEFVSI